MVTYLQLAISEKKKYLFDMRMHSVCNFQFLVSKSEIYCYKPPGPFYFSNAICTIRILLYYIIVLFYCSTNIFRKLFPNTMRMYFRMLVIFERNCFRRFFHCKFSKSLRQRKQRVWMLDCEAGLYITIILLLRRWVQRYILVI